MWYYSQDKYAYKEITQTHNHTYSTHKIMFGTYII